MIQSGVSSCVHKTVHPVTKVPAALLSDDDISGIVTASDYSVTEGDTVTLTFEDTSIAGAVTASDYSVIEGDTVTLEFDAVTNTYQWIDGDGANISGETGLTTDWLATLLEVPRIKVTNGTTGKSKIFSASAIAVSEYVGPPIGSVTISDTTATEGDQITFGHAVTGATDYQLYKDGVWVWGGDSLPLTRRVGTVDAGEYKIVATGPGGSLTTAGVSMTVAESLLLSDDFSSGVAAGWSVSGSPSVSGGKLNVDAAILSKAITDNNCRVRFTVDASGMTSGYVTVARLLGSAHAILNVEILESAGLKYMRVAPNVQGFYSGGAVNFGYDPPATYISIASFSTTTIEIRWDFSTKSVWVYQDDTLIAAVRDSTNTGGFSPTAATLFSIGTLSGSFTGSITIDDVKIKQGNPAGQAFTAKSRLGLVHVFGQSNGAGAAPGSYSAITDAVPNLVFVDGGAWSGTALSDYLGTPSSISSTSSVFAFLQNINLPSGFSAVAQRGAVGSTSFTQPPGANNWNATNGLYRQRCIGSSEILANTGEEVANIAILFHGFEGDAGVFTQSTWNAELALFLSELRTAIGDADCPLVIGGFSPAYLTGGPNELADFIAIDSWNSNFVANVDTVEGAFGSSMTPSALSYQAGSPAWIHFDAAGYRALGARMASAIKAIYAKFATLV